MVLWSLLSAVAFAQGTLILPEQTFACEDVTTADSDEDHNDLVVRFTKRCELNVSGLVTREVLHFAPVAAGASLTSSLVLDLDQGSSGYTGASVTLTAEEAAPVTLPVAAGRVTLFSDFKASFGAVGGFVNTEGAGVVPGPTWRVEVAYATPIATSGSCPLPGLALVRDTVTVDLDTDLGPNHRPLAGMYSGDWAPPTERTAIGTAYPQFLPWADSVAGGCTPGLDCVSEDWFDFPGAGVVARPSLWATAPLATYADHTEALSDGLVAWLDLQETGCGGVADQQGLATATCYGSSHGAVAKVGRGLDRGTAVGNGLKLDLPAALTDTYTLTLWFLPSDLTYHSANDGAGIVFLNTVSPDSDGTIAYNGYRPPANTPSTARLKWGEWAWGDGDTPATEGRDTGYNLTVGKWVHLALVKHGPNDADFYVDGALAGHAASDFDFPLGPTVWFANYSIRTGNTNNHFARGTLDEIGVWDRDLDAHEVRALFEVQQSGMRLYGPPVSSDLYASQAAASSDGLTHWFRFEETTCGALADREGGPSGTCYGTGTATTGKVGGAIDRGTAVNNGFSLPIGGTYPTGTVSVWFKMTDPTIYNDNDGAGILWLSNTWDGTVGYNNYRLPSNTYSQSRLKFGSWPRGDGDAPPLEALDSGVNLTVGQWVHLVVVKTSATTADLYVNGELKVHHTAFSWGIGNPLWLGNYSLHDAGNGNTHYPRGVYDECAVWNRPLSATEVQSLYAVQLAGGLVHP